MNMLFEYSSTKKNKLKEGRRIRRRRNTCRDGYDISRKLQPNHHHIHNDNLSNSKMLDGFTTISHKKTTIFFSVFFLLLLGTICFRAPNHTFSSCFCFKLLLIDI